MSAVTVDADVLSAALRGDATALAEVWALLAGPDGDRAVEGGSRSGRVREVRSTGDAHSRESGHAPGTVLFGRVVE